MIIGNKRSREEIAGTAAEPPSYRWADQQQDRQAEYGSAEPVRQRSQGLKAAAVCERKVKSVEEQPRKRQVQLGLKGEKRADRRDGKNDENQASPSRDRRQTPSGYPCQCGS